MSSKHLLLRNGHFYYRQWIPLDLRSHFSDKVEIISSLKTKDKQQALALAGVCVRKQKGHAD